MPPRRADLAAFSKDYETTYLRRPDDRRVHQAGRRTAPDSIVLALTIFKDSSGRNFIPREAIRQIAQTAGAPICGPYPAYIDYGVVGGNVVTFSSLGTTIADLVLDVIAGKEVSSVRFSSDIRRRRETIAALGPVRRGPPPGTVQMFKEKTFWEQYRYVIVAALAVIIAQGVVIAGLLVERRRRRKAQVESHHRLLEVVHLNQSATAGALSASIAHELNQPSEPFAAMPRRRQSSFGRRHPI